jgi:hypothetical protein
MAGPPGCGWAGAERPGGGRPPVAVVPPASAGADPDRRLLLWLVRLVPVARSRPPSRAGSGAEAGAPNGTGGHRLRRYLDTGRAGVTPLARGVGTAASGGARCRPRRRDPGSTSRPEECPGRCRREHHRVGLRHRVSRGCASAVGPGYTPAGRADSHAPRSRPRRRGRIGREGLPPARDLGGDRRSAVASPGAPATTCG